MVSQVKHRFVSAKADDADITLVRPSNWNDEHTVPFVGVVTYTSSAQLIPNNTETMIDFDVVQYGYDSRFRSSASGNLSGTASIALFSDQLVGSGTSFLTQLAQGMVISAVESGQTYYFMIKSVESNTAATVFSSNEDVALTGKTWTRRREFISLFDVEYEGYYEIFGSLIWDYASGGSGTGQRSVAVGRLTNGTALLMPADGRPLGGRGTAPASTMGPVRSSVRTPPVWVSAGEAFCLYGQQNSGVGQYCGGQSGGDENYFGFEFVGE